MQTMTKTWPITYQATSRIYVILHAVIVHQQNKRFSTRCWIVNTPSIRVTVCNQQRRGITFGIYHVRIYHASQINRQTLSKLICVWIINMRCASFIKLKLTLFIVHDCFGRAYFSSDIAWFLGIHTQGTPCSRHVGGCRVDGVGRQIRTQICSNFRRWTAFRFARGPATIQNFLRSFQPRGTSHIRTGKYG